MVFTFGVITFNHEKYILEHLESIKYQIIEWGANIIFQLIIADDGSKDNTIQLTESWLKENNTLFDDVVILADKKNNGTCHNYTKIWEHITGDYCKITAGDDVYSFSNLFGSLKELDTHHIITGLPLMLIDNHIYLDKAHLFHMAATDVIYRNVDYIERLKKISVANAPNIFIACHVFKNKDIFNFVRRYSVTEDFPLHIKMAEEYSPLKSVQLKSIYVYYRRTSNSTYISKNTEFNSDKIDLYEYLFDKEKNRFNRILIKNRLFCFKIKNRRIASLLNINYYIYLFKLVLNIVPVIKFYRKIEIDIAIHQNHQKLIHNRANEFLEKHKAY